MDKKKTDAIREWLYATQEKSIEPFETAFSKTFGSIVMEDGRKAQIKVTLELDEEEYLDDDGDLYDQPVNNEEKTQ